MTPVKVPEGGFDPGENSQERELGRALGLLESHLAGDLAKGAGGRPTQAKGISTPDRDVARRPER